MNTERVTRLADIEGLPLTPEARLPMPHLLRRWQDAGLVEIDTETSRFRLTPKGDFAARAQRRREILERAAGVSDQTVAIEFGS